ncbi:hypothetical protein Tco_1447890 [Tanacetum coccineum]
MRYIDTRPHGDALRKCILQGPYKLSTIIIPAQLATNDSPVVEARIVLEDFSNISIDNKAHYDVEKEAIHLLLTGIGDKIYSTVDACKTAHDMWIAIERLQHDESLNIQDVKTNLFWEFGRFTSHDGESMESYYSRFYKMINEMIRNNLEVATTQVNVHLLLQQLKDSQECKSTRACNTEDSDCCLRGYRRLVGRSGVPLQAEQADWLEDTDEEIDKQELEAHYSYMAKIQEVPTADSGTNTEPLKNVQYDAEYNVFANERQHFDQPESINDTYVVEQDDGKVIP